MKRRIQRNQKTTEIRSRILKRERDNPSRQIPEMYLDRERAAVDNLRSVYLVAKRPRLSVHPFLWRHLARLVYKRIGWCPDYGIEYMGVYTDESEARHAASSDGLFYMELPLNSSLPDEVCQFGAHDFPHSEASPEYRNRQFAFTAVPTYQLGLLKAKLDQTDQCLVGECSEVRG
jgi:hypothetical protein